jgi:hypothetical protein
MVWASSLDDSDGDAAAALSVANGRSNLKLVNQAAKSSTLTAVSLFIPLVMISSFDADKI